MWKKVIKCKFLLVIICLVLFLCILFYIFKDINVPTSSVSYWTNNEFFSSSNIIQNETTSDTENKKYIKWFEFNVTYTVLDKTYKLDVNSHNKNEKVKLNWIELISYLACKYGNDFSKFKQSDLDTLVSKLKAGQTMESLTSKMKNYNYYFEGYNSVLHEFVDTYQIETVKSSNANNSTASLDKVNNFNEKYGLKAFHPIAKNYSYSHYDDFGASRSYGYKRLHFGNDLMGSIGTPVIAVESGIVEAIRLESVWWLENWHSKL